MDTYYTIDEKYLQAVEEVRYGESPKGMQLLKEIIENDPFYARAHFQLGKVYFYEMDDYQSAGFHFKTCVEIEPAFPDVYFDYLNLLVFLNMQRMVHEISEKALAVPGVCKAEIYGLLGLFYEHNADWAKALTAYRRAYLEATEKDFSEEMTANIKRINAKMRDSAAYRYDLSG